MCNISNEACVNLDLASLAASSPLLPFVCDNRAGLEFLLA